MKYKVSSNHPSKQCPTCGTEMEPEVDVAAREVTERSALTLHCHRCGHVSRAPKEPWDLETFIRYYNEAAREQSGWSFEPSDHDLDSLKYGFEHLDDYIRLSDYAKDTFVFDQLTGVEGSD